MSFQGRDLEDNRFFCQGNIWIKTRWKNALRFLWIEVGTPEALTFRGYVKWNWDSYLVQLSFKEKPRKEKKWPSMNICGRTAAGFTMRNFSGLWGLYEEVMLYCKESKQQSSKMTFEKRSVELSDLYYPCTLVNANCPAVLSDNHKAKWERGTKRTSQHPHYLDEPTLAPPAPHCQKKGKM